jgi:hypothetical protein
MDDLIHFRPSEHTKNVRCLNGSAHVKFTYDIDVVTCPLCKDEKNHASFWFMNGQPKYPINVRVFTMTVSK